MLHYLLICVTNHSVAKGCKQCVALCIIIKLLDVNTSIDLNHQMSLKTTKVHNKTIDHVLTAELATIELAISQTFPQQYLSRCLLSPKLSRSLLLCSRHSPALVVSIVRHFTQLSGNTPLPNPSPAATKQEFAEIRGMGSATAPE
jgi:hypothetical protein